jgi:hypothetical protein
MRDMTPRALGRVGDFRVCATDLSLHVARERMVSRDYQLTSENRSPGCIEQLRLHFGAQGSSA